jgi:hypothetical protein
LATTTAGAEHSGIERDALDMNAAQRTTGCADAGRALSATDHGASGRHPFGARAEGDNGRDEETLMAPLLRRLPGRRRMQSVRVTVAWQQGRIRRIKLEYVRPHLLQRLINAARR